MCWGVVVSGESVRWGDKCIKGISKMWGLVYLSYCKSCLNFTFVVERFESAPNFVVGDCKS